MDYISKIIYHEFLSFFLSFLFWTQK